MLFQNSCVIMPSQCRVKGCKSLTGLYKANSEVQRSKWKEALSFTGKGNNKDKPSTETDKKTCEWDYIMTKKYHELVLNAVKKNHTLILIYFIYRYRYNSNSNSK